MLLVRAGKPKQDPFRIRAATGDDWPHVEHLLQTAQRQYQALEWWTIEQWLDNPSLLLALDAGGHRVGLALAVIDEAPISWLRAVCVTSDRYILPLLSNIAEAMAQQGAAGLAFLGDQYWIISRLQQLDFQQINRVVTLQHRGPWQKPDAAPGLRLRVGTPADIKLILEVDHAAFAPLWWYSTHILMQALDLAHSFHVAFMDRECVGYQFSTLRAGRGHIVRLAVHPRWQRQGIGGRLLSEAMEAFFQARPHTITVNTQEDNEASLQLYRRFSFDRTDTPWGVWFRTLEQA